MRQATLGLIYLVKYLELAFLFAWTFLIIGSGVYFIGQVMDRQGDGDFTDGQYVIFPIIAMIFASFNLFYNNLMINLRFMVKMSCVTFGLCCFDAFNYIFCYCFLVKPCKDNCFTAWTTFKWLIKAILIGYTIFLISWLVQQKKDS